MEALLIECVQSSLRHFMYQNAIFLCERLCAEFPSELNLQLLANCFLRNNQAYCAYYILKGTQMAQSRYLFALSCFQMNLLREAEAALCAANESNSEVPNGAAGHYLLGLIYRYTDRRKRAVDHFTQALQLDPFCWSAYEELCILGSAEEASAIFGEGAALRIQQQPLKLSSSSQTEETNVLANRVLSTEDASPRQLKHLHGNIVKESFPSHSLGAVMGLGPANQLANCGSNSLYSTPSPVSVQASGIAPPPLCRNAQPHLGAVGGEGSPRPTVNAAVQAPRRKLMEEGKLRKVSGRLFSDSGPRRSTRLSGEATSHPNLNATQTVGSATNHTSKLLGGLSFSSKTTSAAFRSVKVRRGQAWATENIDEGRLPEVLEESQLDKSTSIATALTTGDDKSAERDRTHVQTAGGAQLSGSKVQSGVVELLGLLRTVGEGYRLSCLYKCKDALEAYLKLSHQQYNTGWVLSQVGKAYFELVDNCEADNAFRLARHLSPYTLEGMDIYSTVLYHLKEELKLSCLAQDLISTDRLSPQAWCAIGNCYSLQKDHETALKNFQRAVQLEAKFAYAHTLCGHEHVALEDFDCGIKCYQSALRVDPRHYNAWYGLGMVYLRQEKYELAEHHFREAFLLNPGCSVLMCYLGMALHSLKRDEEALAMMEKAILADKKNPLPMYQKGNILFSLEKFDEALKVLEHLKECVPRESSVWALMGKIYKRLGIYDKAMLHYGHALDLKPSAADVASIKSAIEKLNVPDDLDES